MRACLLTDIISPHQMPLARQVAARLGADNFRYISTVAPDAGRWQQGWFGGETPAWVVENWRGGEQSQTAAEWARSADVVLCGLRDLALFRQRAAAGRPTFYMSERWFKPPLGAGRLLHPRFLRMALAFRRLARSPHLHYLAMGRLAAADMRRLGAFRNRTWLWGYFVDGPAEPRPALPAGPRPLEILCAGRMLRLKRLDLLVDVLAQLAREGRDCRLRLIGGGVREAHLRAQVRRLGIEERVTFQSFVPIQEVRGWMRKADVYVLPSNGQEGWGTVVNEAMSEGCAVLVSNATGVGATLLTHESNGLLFRSGCAVDLACQLRRLCDDADLRRRIAAAGRECMEREWSPAVAAERLLALGEALANGRPPPQYASGPLQPL